MSKIKVDKIGLGETGKFSPFFLDYLSRDAKLKPYYGLFPDQTERFIEQINQTTFPLANRRVLQTVLNKQYSQYTVSEKVWENIELLEKENTYTITTGHQLNIFTGPLYFIYKIITTINTARLLQKKHPEYNFVPVYWMASEDHDFEEINHFFIQGKKYTWESTEKGAVGRFNPEDIVKIAHDLGLPESFIAQYRNNKTLAGATRGLVNNLFGKYGLVVLDPDDAELKSIFKPIIKKDILASGTFNLVEQTTKELIETGYKPQVHPRPVNFFYLVDGIRERIVNESGKFKVLNTAIEFSENDLLQEIALFPERFSPNVVLRPVYQQLILPNLAYIGGPAEVVYWLQLKKAFEYYQISFPLLMPRNFGLIVPLSFQTKLEKIGLSIEDFFKDDTHLKAKILQLQKIVNHAINGEIKLLDQVFSTLKEKAVATDKSLGDYIGAQRKQMEKLMVKIGNKIRKAEEKKLGVWLDRIEAIKTGLFPGGNLQERHDNILDFYTGDPEIIDQLMEVLDPLDFDFNIMSYNN